MGKSPAAKRLNTERGRMVGMKKQTRKRILVFLLGLLIVSFVTIIGTLAFLDARLVSFARNVVITDAIFIIFYVVWIKLNRGYETMYKSGLELEDKK